MDIAGYQIENVLNVYRRQLAENGPTRHHRRTDPETESPSSLKNRRRSVFEKVAADIANKIADYGPQTASTRQALTSLQQESQRSIFSYNFLDHRNRKVSGSLALDDLAGLLERSGEPAAATQAAGKATFRKGDEDV